MSAINSGGVGAGTNWRAHLLALAGYFLLALLVTYPVVAQFASGVPGDLVADRDQNLWNLWWVKESLFRFTDPFHTDMLYYPYSADLYYHTLALPLGLVGLIPQLLFSLPAAYNTVLLVGFTLSGYGMFRLLDYGLQVWEPGWSAPKRLAAFLGGVVFAFTPYTLDALKGQPEVLSLQWMPPFVEMWLRGLTGAREYVKRDMGLWKFGVGAGVFLALTAYTNLYYAVYLVLFVVAHVLYRLVVSVRMNALHEEARRIVRVGSVMASVAIVLGWPLLVGLAVHRNDPRLAVEADPEHRLTHSADLLSFFAPPHDHLLFGTWQDAPGVNEPPLHDYVGLGYVALALAVLGTITMWRKPGVRFWFILMVAALLLAMGPQLQIGRNRTGIPMPFALLEWLPGMDAIAKPERFVVLARLCMGVLAAWGAIWLLGRRGADVPVANAPQTGGHARTGYSAVGVLLVLGLLIELPIHPRFMQTIADLPFYRAYETLASQPAGALMELPFATQQSETIGRRMLLQTVHDKPIMAGYLSRRYDSPIIDSCSPFWGFISPLDVPREDIASPVVVNRLLDVLNFYDIRYISLYTSFTGVPNDQGDQVPTDQVEALDTIVSDTTNADSPIFEGTALGIYSVKTESLGDAPPSFHIGAGWYPVEQSGGQPFRWVQDGQGSLCVFTPQDVTGSLVMAGTAFAQDRSITMTVGDEDLYSGTLASGDFTTVKTATRHWQAGVTQIDISSPEAGTSPISLDPNAGDNRELTVGFRGVTLEIELKR